MNCESINWFGSIIGGVIASFICTLIIVLWERVLFYFKFSPFNGKYTGYELNGKKHEKFGGKEYTVKYKFCEMVLLLHLETKSDPEKNWNASILIKDYSATTYIGTYFYKEEEEEEPKDEGPKDEVLAAENIEEKKLQALGFMQILFEYEKHPCRIIIISSPSNTETKKYIYYIEKNKDEPKIAILWNKFKNYMKKYMKPLKKQKS